jgi:hypothetical protein
MWQAGLEACDRFLQHPDLSAQMRAAYQSFDFALALECHRVISPVKGCHR